MKKYLLILIILTVFFVGCDPKIAEHASKRIDVSGYSFQTVDGIKVAYQKFGNGEPLVLIHGFMGNSTNFETIFEELSKDFTVVAVDLPGFGLSDKNIPKPLSRRYLAKVVSDLAVQLGFSSYSVLGHSMGGEVAMWIAIDNPDVVKKLILVSSAGRITDSSSPADFINIPFFQVFARMTFFSYAFLKSTWLDMLVEKENFDEAYFLKNYSLMYRTPYKVIANLANSSDTSFLMEEIEQITVPTMIIWGKQDSIIPADHAFWFHEKIKNSELVIINEAGHLSFIDKPYEFAKTIKDFLMAE